MNEFYCGRQQRILHYFSWKSFESIVKIQATQALVTNVREEMENGSYKVHQRIASFWRRLRGVDSDSQNSSYEWPDPYHLSEGEDTSSEGSLYTEGSEHTVGYSEESEESS